MRYVACVAAVSAVVLMTGGVFADAVDTAINGSSGDTGGDLEILDDTTTLVEIEFEATAFGAKKIVDRFESEGVPIKGIIALGGVAKKSPFVMQVLADVLNRPIEVARSEQACALGAAMFAATAAGIYGTVGDALEAMESGFETEYTPDPDRAKEYEILYDKYSKLGTFIEQEA